MRRLILRYRKLNLWSKVGLWGALASIAALFLWFIPSSAPSKVTQVMKDSPGGIQIGGDVRINTDRQIPPQTVHAIRALSRSQPCSVVAGTIAFGEGTRLAESFLRMAKEAGCETSGVNHGIGFQAFNGIKLLYPQENPPMELVRGLYNILRGAGLEVSVELGSNVPPGALYFYVGYKG